MSNLYQERDALVEQIARAVTGKDAIQDQVSALRHSLARLNAPTISAHSTTAEVASTTPAAPPPEASAETLDSVRAQINRTRDPVLRSKLAAKAAALVDGTSELRAELVRVQAQLRETTDQKTKNALAARSASIRETIRQKTS